MTNVESAWRSTEVLNAGPLVWAESPRWRDGALWVSDTQSSRLVVVAGDAPPRVHEVDSAVNGTGFLPSGELVAARMHEQRLDRFDGSTWSVQADLSKAMTGKLGDLIVLADGTVYVDEVRGHSEPGRILKVDLDGSVSVAADDLVFPNGLALTDDGATLVVAETFAARLSAFRLGPDGELLDKRVYLDLGQELSPDHRPDGIWGCADGSIWVAATAGESVVRVQDGLIVERLEVDGFAIACCMNADETELYVGVATSVDPTVAVLDAVYEKQVTSRVLRFTRTDAAEGFE
jgi:sugar lactone lactonase YvrE